MEDITHMSSPARRPRPGVDVWHPLSSTLIPASRAPHANRGTLRRPHFDRTYRRQVARAVYWRGVAFNEMGKTANGKRSLAVYAHSSARQEAPALAMAA